MLRSNSKSLGNHACKAAVGRICRKGRLLTALIVHVDRVSKQALLPQGPRDALYQSKSVSTAAQLQEHLVQRIHNKSE